MQCITDAYSDLMVMASAGSRWWKKAKWSSTGKGKDSSLFSFFCIRLIALFKPTHISQPHSDTEGYLIRRLMERIGVTAVKRAVGKLHSRQFCQIQISNVPVRMTAITPHRFFSWPWRVRRSCADLRS